MTHWRITRSSATRAAVCFLLAVGLMFSPFEELAHALGRGGFIGHWARSLEKPGQRLGRLILVALGIYGLPERCDQQTKGALK